METVFKMDFFVNTTPQSPDENISNYSQCRSHTYLHKSTTFHKITVNQTLEETAFSVAKIA